MKIIKFSAIIIVVLTALGLAYFYFFAGAEGFSTDQEEVRELLGVPDQFTIAYLPQGEEGSYVRSEIWRYSAAGKEVSFLGGEIYSSEDYTAPEEMTATGLSPETFDSESTLEEINTVLGETAVLFEWPGITGDDVQSYLSSQALFTFESGYLTYFETISQNSLSE